MTEKTNYEKLASVCEHYESIGYRVLPEASPASLAPSPVTDEGDIVTQVFQVVIKVIDAQTEPNQLMQIFTGWASGATLNEARDSAWKDALEQALARTGGE